MDQDLPNCLPVVPLGNTAGHLLQEVFMVLQDLGDLVKYLVHKERVHDGAAVRLFEGTHVTLKGQEDIRDKCETVKRTGTCPSTAFTDISFLARRASTC